MSVRDKSATAIEPLRCFVFADDGQLNQFNAFARMTENRFDQIFGDAGTTRDGANVHAPQKALVSPLCSGLRAVAGHAEKSGQQAGATDRRNRQIALRSEDRMTPKRLFEDPLGKWQANSTNNLVVAGGQGQH